tara:strand:+ start:5729 stop:6571 length:843 start_codon:yes stop_codon:yes gene_type:complete
MADGGNIPAHVDGVHAAQVAVSPAQPGAISGPAGAIPAAAPGTPAQTMASPVQPAAAVGTVYPTAAPPAAPTIVGNQSPQDPPPRRRARRATAANRGGKNAARAARAADLVATPLTSPMPAAAVGAAPVPAAMTAPQTMVQPMPEMWTQYSNAVHQFMDLQSKTIDKLLEKAQNQPLEQQPKRIRIDDTPHSEPAATRASETQNSKKIILQKQPQRQQAQSDSDTDSDSEPDTAAGPSSLRHLPDTQSLRAHYGTPQPKSAPTRNAYTNGGAIDLASYYK